MPNYRRNRIAGATYFFTVTLHERGAHTLTENIGALRTAVSQVRRARSFQIDAWVVLPDHLHALWTLPAGDDVFSTRWKEIKGLFSRSLPVTKKATWLRPGERGIWQRRFWEHTIRDDRDFAAHFDYVHFNPVKHGLVSHAAGWPYSTFHRSVALGLYPATWAGANVDLAAGEPP